MHEIVERQVEPDRQQLKGVRRAVIKVGTAVVTRDDGRLALGRLGALVEQVQGLRARGIEVVLVSSGAVGLGAERLGFDQPPRAVVDRQACAAAGQGALMGFYAGLFEAAGGRCAQVLLTEDDFSVRRRHVHLAATLLRLLSLGAVPVVNENDTVSTAEIALTGPTVFGDNDRLAALVASGIDADLLVLLTDVDGIYDRPPAEPGARPVTTWGDTEVRLGTASSRGRGGMGAKIEAAQVGASSGVHVVVAGAQLPDVLRRIVDGQPVGTWFPATGALSGKRRWLAFATAPEGVLTVNAGARNALVERQASLLLPGIVDVQGTFGEGAVVSVVDEEGREFARGHVALDADALRAARAAHDGAKGKPVVHRDDVVILEGT